ncbi:MAG TPA: histidine phosphatase family protein [Pyrinomonadaceae bacterium]|nr:histidine phosphatase family protein [Pyrinomonadaceae bacterium]
MKTLLLMRHAKSSWADPGQPDFERPLNERGQKAAPLMGRFMRQRSLQPDLVISSPAARARQTAELALAAAEFTCETRSDARIYEASAAQLLEVVREIEEQISIALLVGHNPSMEEFVHLLTGASERMPTAALACVAFDLNAWHNIEPQMGRLAWLVKPKELAGKIA